jgi:excinuclease ABC subunit A
VVAVGTLEEIAADPKSYTGRYLKQVFDRRRSGKAKRAAAASSDAPSQQGMNAS